MPGCKLMGWLGIGLGLCQRRSNGGGTPTPTPSVSTPVITQESAATTAPFEWSWADDPTIFEGYYAEVARTTGANTAAASAALIAATPNGSDPTLASLNGHDIHQLTLDDLSSSVDTVFSGLTTTPTGVPLALRMRFGHEDGLGGYVWGNWSNVLTDDIAVASTATLATVNGVDKNQFLTLSGGNLTATMNNVIGARVGVRTATAVTGKRHFEVNIDHIQSLIEVGVIDTPFNFNTTANPAAGGGGTGAGGFSILFDTSTSTVIYYNGTNVGGTSPALASGDKIIVEFDTAGLTATIWHNRAGTNTSLASFTMTSATPSAWTAYVCGATNAGVGDGITVNFGATTFAKALSSGYSFYG